MRENRIKTMKFILISICLFIFSCAFTLPAQALPKTQHIVILSSIGDYASFTQPYVMSAPRTYKRKIPGLGMDRMINNTLKNYLVSKGYSNISTIKPSSQIFAKGVPANAFASREFSGAQKAYLRKLARSSKADIFVLVVRDLYLGEKDFHTYLRGFGYWNMDFPLNKTLHTFANYGMYIVNAKTLEIIGNNWAYTVESCPKQLWSNNPKNVSQAAIRHLKAWVIPWMKRSINNKISTMIN